LLPYLTDWLHLLVRWAHFTVGIAWIGASFYFNWLNNSVRELKKPEPGVLGEVWSVHGGAFYRVTKQDSKMEKLPEPLHWFKYEAYFTWITGVLLLGIIYYFGKTVPLVSESAGLHHHAAVGVGIGSMVLFWVIYDILCKSPVTRSPRLLFAILFSILTVAAYGLSEIFTPRAAYIHVGAMIGTAMAANVFFVIIPGQKAMVDATMRGEVADPAHGAAGAMRSLHNNYFTLPILFIMISSHFPATFGHHNAWAVLAALGLISATVRYWFNLSGRGGTNRWLLPLAGLATVTLAMSIKPAPRVVANDDVSWSQVAPIIASRCLTCHAETPTFPGYPIAPKGIILENETHVQTHSASITQQIQTQIMPLGNLTHMTDDERGLVLDFLQTTNP
jgi:uncharacterized membrane protein